MTNKRIVFVILFIIFIIGYFLRVMYLPKNILTFGYDQARDAVISQQIISGDLKIQGPPSSAPGLYHGVLYYYVLAIGYTLGQNPVNAAYWIAFLSASTIFVVFLLGYKLTGKVKVGLVSAFLFAVSLEATQYATWLSNPTLAMLTVPLMYLGLWLWTKKDWKYAPILCALGLGFSIQFEIFLAYHIIPLTIWLWFSRKKITKNQIVIFFITLVLSLSSLVLCEFKFGFNGIDGVKVLLTGQGPNLAYAKSVGDFAILYLNQIGRIFAFNSLPSNIGYGGGLVIFLIIYSLIRKDYVGTFLSSWLLSHLSVVSVGGVSTPFLMVGIGPAVSLILANYILKLRKEFVVLALLIIAASNISMIFKENSKGSTLFSIQNEMTLQKELQVIDYTYQKSDKKPFTLNSLTSPLYINIVWSYLYNWYGQDKYGYVPSYHGHNQVGQVTKLPDYEEETRNAYLVIEPMGGIPVRYLDETLVYEDDISKIIEEKNWGEYRVQKREIHIK